MERHRENTTPILQQLEKEAAIALSKNNRSVKVSLTNKGLELLSERLKSPEFKYKANVVGAKTANALLKWMRQMNGTVSSSTAPSKDAGLAIASYKQFKQVALEVYDRLNRDYNLDDLVPIYRIRREIGDRVTRSQFNEWLMEMQANKVLQLIGGEMPDITPNKAEDSIKTKLGGVRYYAKRL